MLDAASTNSVVAHLTSGPHKACSEQLYNPTYRSRVTNSYHESKLALYASINSTKEGQCKNLRGDAGALIFRHSWTIILKEC